MNNNNMKYFPQRYLMSKLLGRDAACVRDILGQLKLQIIVRAYGMFIFLNIFTSGKHTPLDIMSPF